MKIGNVILNGYTDLDWQAEKNYVIHIKKQTTLTLRAKLHLFKGLYKLETHEMTSLKTQLRENR